MHSAIPDLPTLGKALFNNEWDTKKRISEAAGELGKPATYLAAPFGGGQIKKAIQTIDGILKGGRYSINAEGEEQLQYPIYTDSAGDLVRSALFGPTTTSTGREWVESGFPTLGTKETAVYQALTQDLDIRQQDAYELIQDIRAAEKTEDMSESEQERQVLSASDVSGEAKAAIYYGMMASDREKAAMDKVLDLNADAGTVYEVLNDLHGVTKSAEKQDVIFESALDAEQKLSMYYDMVASEEKKEEIDNLTGEGMDAAEIVDMLDEYGKITTQEKQYREMKESGIETDSAMAVYEAIQALTPAEGKKDTSAQQKYTAIVGTDLPDEEKLAAIRAYDTSENESAYAEYAAAYDAGIDLEAFDEYRAAVAATESDKDANGNTISGSKKEKVLALIDAMPITIEQKDLLYEMEGYAESTLYDAPWYAYAGQLPAASNGFRATYTAPSGIRSGTLRGSNSLRGANSLRGGNKFR